MKEEVCVCNPMTITSLSYSAEPERRNQKLLNKLRRIAKKIKATLQNKIFKKIWNLIFHLRLENASLLRFLFKIKRFSIATQRFFMILLTTECPNLIQNGTKSQPKMIYDAAEGALIFSRKDCLSKVLTKLQDLKDDFMGKTWQNK